MSRQRNSINNLIWGIVGNIVTAAVAIIIPRLFIVNYGSEINGLLASIRQVYVYLALLEVGIGDASVVALYAPIGKKDYNAANRILSATNYYYKKNWGNIWNLCAGIRSSVSVIVKYNDTIWCMFWSYSLTGIWKCDKLFGSGKV